MRLQNLCHTEKSYSLLQDSFKRMIDDLLESSSNSFISPYEHRDSLWRVFAKHKIALPPEFFSTLEKDDSIEIWTSMHDFIFAMGNVLLQTSYSPEELTTNPWSELFERSEENNTKILNAVMRALETNQPQFNVADYHLVKESKSKNQTEHLIAVKLVAPIYLPMNRMGIVAVTKVKKPSKPILFFRLPYLSSKYRLLK